MVSSLHFNVNRTTVWRNLARGYCLVPCREYLVDDAEETPKRKTYNVDEVSYDKGHVHTPLGCRYHYSTIIHYK